MKRFIEAHDGEEFDVIIIGGGITGAAVAYDAAGRGLKTALVEKGDFGGATSAATSKLIHGGLRYLANMEVGLVRESLRERKTLENIAPNFVYPMANMIVNYRKPLKNNKWFIKVGMALYDILSFDKKFTWDKSKKIPLHTTIGAKKASALEPNINRDELTGASIYYDCISIFPERLTLAFIKSAVKNGAEVSNYTRVESFIRDGNFVRGIRVRDLLSDREREIRGRLTINCGGPWADIILSKAKGSGSDQQIRRSEGIHVITKRLINDHIVTSMTHEGKHFFIIPWRNHSLIGTTDKEYIGSPDEWSVTAKSINELLDDVNGAFGNGRRITYDDIQFTYGGLRPLVEDQTEDVYESSRKYEIYDNAADGLEGLITVEGGKYTTSRNLAEKVLETVCEKLGKKREKSITDKKRLAGSEIDDMEGYIVQLKKDNPDFDEKTIEYLGRNYGTEISNVLELARKDSKLAGKVNDDGEILAEVVYAARHEMAKTLSDIIFRRTGMGTLGHPGEAALKTIASIAAKELRWSEARLKKEIETARKRFILPQNADASGEVKMKGDKIDTGQVLAAKTNEKGGDFIPDWRETPPAEKSYRSLFKWGAPDGYKHPNKRLYRVVKEIFGLNDTDFQSRHKEGDEIVRCTTKSRLAASHIKALKAIVGDENVSVDDYSRARFASGKTVEEAMLLRNGLVERPADAAVHPRDKEDVKKIVQYCNRYRIPIYPYGGGSSVNFGLRPARGGISLVLSTHMNSILHLNESNQTVRVQPGMMGPAYENMLNNAPEKLGACRRYTCGHFPQSFEYSSVGGWVVTLGSGQASSYYGDAYHLVLGQEYVTPAGEIKTLEFPATATGPKLNDIMKGNEGCYGILVELTMKVYRYMPENRQKFAYIFPTWEAAVDAGREICQAEFGMPAVLRLSDPEETDIALKLYGLEGTIIDRFMKLRGFKKMSRCLMLGSAEGEADFAKNIKRRCKKICRRYGGMYLTGYPVSQWEHGRYTDPYMREDLMDYGIIIDTLESGVSWDRLHDLHKGTRAFAKARPKTVCMAHASHFYPQGTNLYFIYIMKTDDIQEYIRFQDGIIESMIQNGGSLSHHHGVGRMLSPWVKEHLGDMQFNVLKVLKKHFDPKGIMNPGGQLGLDLKTKDWRSIK